MRAVSIALAGGVHFGVAGYGGSSEPAGPSGVLAVRQLLTRGLLYIEGSRSYISARPEAGREAKKRIAELRGA